MPTCLEWAEQRVESCSEWEDQGYDECNEWDQKCCTWWPCSWGCKLVTWVCKGAVWISKWVCVGWTVATTAACVAWDFVTTIINAVIVTLESSLGWLISAVGFLVELVLTIPVLGALIRWGLNAFTTVYWFFGSLPDAALGLVGIRPEKLLRVCTVILSDETGTPLCAPSPYVVNILQTAADVFKREANIRIVPLKPGRYATGFRGAETVKEDWVTTETGNGHPDVLDAPCDASGFGADWGLAGSRFQFLMSANCLYGSWRRLTGYGAPVTCFIVRSIGGVSFKYGCSLGIVDYLTVISHPYPFPVGAVWDAILAHETGHACGHVGHLGVSSHPDNLMSDPWLDTAPPLQQTRLNTWQVLLMRSSRHVTYF